MDSNVPGKDHNRILGVLQKENISILELVNMLLTEKYFIEKYDYHHTPQQTG